MYKTYFIPFFSKKKSQKSKKKVLYIAYKTCVVFFGIFITWRDDAGILKIPWVFLEFPEAGGMPLEFCRFQIIMLWDY